MRLQEIGCQRLSSVEPQMPRSVPQRQRIFGQRNSERLEMKAQLFPVKIIFSADLISFAFHSIRRNFHLCHSLVSTHDMGSAVVIPDYFLDSRLPP